MKQEIWTAANQDLRQIRLELNVFCSEKIRMKPAMSLCSLSLLSLALLLASCGEVPTEEDSENLAPIAEPGLRPTPRPDAGSGGESTTSGRVAVKVSPGRIQSISRRVGLEGNVTTTYHSTKAIHVGLDITTSATTSKQTR